MSSQPTRNPFALFVPIFLLALLAIPAQGVDVEFALVARAQVDIRLIPGICWQPIQVTALGPPGVGIVWRGNERIQTLVRGWILEVIQAIEFQGALDRPDRAAG